MRIVNRQEALKRKGEIALHSGKEGKRKKKVTMKKKERKKKDNKKARERIGL